MALESAVVPNQWFYLNAFGIQHSGITPVFSRQGTKGRRGNSKTNNKRALKAAYFHKKSKIGAVLAKSHKKYPNFCWNGRKQKKGLVIPEKCDKVELQKMIGRTKKGVRLAFDLVRPLCEKAGPVGPTTGTKGVLERTLVQGVKKVFDPGMILDPGKVCHLLS